VPADLDVHVVLDNSSTHKTPSIQRWLVRHPRFTFHFTPTYSSWLNLVERWFAELDQTRQPPLRARPRRLDPHLDRQLERRPKPFVWHKTADEILDSLAAYCQRINDSGH
jgi:DDE superfamily endonuclease